MTKEPVEQLEIGLKITPCNECRKNDLQNVETDVLIGELTRRFSRADILYSHSKEMHWFDCRVVSQTKECSAISGNRDAIILVLQS